MADVSSQIAEYWQGALAASPQLAFVMDDRQRIVAASQGMAHACGTAIDGLLGHHCMQILHGTDPPESCPMHRLRLGGCVQEGEVHSEVLGRDLHVTVTPLPGPDGVFSHVLHVADDITDRRQMEAALREGEERFAALFNDAPLGYQSLDAEGRFVEVNPMWLATLGYEREEVLGRWFGEFLAPESLDAFRQRFPLFKERGAIHSEFEMLHRDGRRRTVAFEGRIGHNPDGSFRQTHCILSDITERAQVAMALRESEALLRQSQGVARLGHYVFSVAQGTWTSSAVLDEVFGIGPDHPRTVNGWLDIVHPDHRDMMAAYLSDHVIARGRPFDEEYRILRVDDGEERWVHGTGALDFDADGRAVRMFGVIQDVDGRKRAEEEVRRQAERLSQTVAGTVIAMGQLVESRDPYTAGHQRRVAELAHAIGLRLGWDADRLEGLQTASLVHDVGKISVPTEILTKPGRLGATEFELIKDHAQRGFDILSPIGFGAPVAEIVRQHHERLDGSGYPDGLCAAEILPESRVLAVADVAEAMMTHRPYRAALPVQTSWSTRSREASARATTGRPHRPASSCSRTGSPSPPTDTGDRAHGRPGRTGVRAAGPGDGAALW